MSNHDKKFDERSKRPQTIGGALGGLIKIFGIRASDSDLANRWDEIMGTDIASVARLAAIKKNRDNTFNVVIQPPTLHMHYNCHINQTKLLNELTNTLAMMPSVK